MEGGEGSTGEECEGKEKEGGGGVGDNWEGRGECSSKKEFRKYTRNGQGGRRGRGEREKGRGGETEMWHMGEWMTGGSEERG